MKHLFNYHSTRSLPRSNIRKFHSIGFILLPYYTTIKTKKKGKDKREKRKKEKKGKRKKKIFPPKKKKENSCYLDHLVSCLPRYIEIYYICIYIRTYIHTYVQVRPVTLTQ